MSQRGPQRERAVQDRLQAEGWWVARAAGSLGDADLVALRSGSAPMLVEVKSTAGGPYERFGPAERERLRTAAIVAGAVPALAWWPKNRPLRWISADEWPAAREGTTA